MKCMNIHSRSNEKFLENCVNFVMRQKSPCYVPEEYTRINVSDKSIKRIYGYHHIF